MEEQVKIEVIFIEPGKNNFNFKNVAETARLMDQITRPIYKQDNINDSDFDEPLELLSIEKGCIKYVFNVLRKLREKLFSDIRKKFSVQANNKGVNSKGNNNINLVNNNDSKIVLKNVTLNINIENLIEMHDREKYRFLVVKKPKTTSKVYNEKDLNYICEKFIETYVLNRKDMSIKDFISLLNLNNYNPKSLKMLIDNIAYRLNELNIQHTCKTNGLKNISQLAAYCLEMQLIKANLIKY